MTVAIAKKELLDRASVLDRPQPDHPAVLSFSSFRLDLVEERLWKGERELRLRRKPFAILRYLAQRPGKLVTRAELVEAVWGKIAMSESLLRTHVRDLRCVLGEAIIETVVGRGYRLLATTSDTAVRGAAPAGAPRLELVRTAGPAWTGDAGGRITSSTLSTASAGILKRLADALASLNTDAMVVVIEYSARR